VANGFSKNLEINGVGFKAALTGSKLDLALGYSHPISYEVPAGITVTVTDNTKLKVEGADKHMVGQVAATIKSYYPVEPYKGKGVTIVGEYVRRKEGKKTS
jgi:large subunit ribosomal protein L6